MSDNVDALLGEEDEVGDYDLQDDEEEALLNDDSEPTEISQLTEADVLEISVEETLHEEDDETDFHESFQENEGGRDKFTNERAIPVSVSSTPIKPIQTSNANNNRGRGFPRNQRGGGTVRGGSGRGGRGRGMTYKKFAPKVRPEGNKSYFINPHFKGSVQISPNVWTKKPVCSIQPWAVNNNPPAPVRNMRPPPQLQMPPQQAPPPLMQQNHLPPLMQQNLPPPQYNQGPVFTPPVQQHHQIIPVQQLHHQMPPPQHNSQIQPPKPSVRDRLGFNKQHNQRIPPPQSQPHFEPPERQVMFPPQMPPPQQQYNAPQIFTQPPPPFQNQPPPPFQNQPPPQFQNQPVFNPTITYSHPNNFQPNHYQPPPTYEPYVQPPQMQQPPPVVYDNSYHTFEPPPQQHVPTYDVHIEYNNQEVRHHQQPQQQLYNPHQQHQHQYHQQQQPQQQQPQFNNNIVPHREPEVINLRYERPNSRYNSGNSPTKRRNDWNGDREDTMQMKRRYDNSNLHEIKVQPVQTVETVDVKKEVVRQEVQPIEPEEDPETIAYRQKIREQKQLRERFLAEKEERRRKAAKLKQAEDNYPAQPATVAPPSQPPIPRPASEEIKTFLTNRRIIAKDSSLCQTRMVVVSNLAAGTSQTTLRKLCGGVGTIQNFEMSPKERQATIEFNSVASAHAFFKKYQRFMLDLSMINVSLKPETT